MLVIFLCVLYDLHNHRESSSLRYQSSILRLRSPSMLSTEMDPHSSDKAPAFSTEKTKPDKVLQNTWEQIKKWTRGEDIWQHCRETEHVFCGNSSPISCQNKSHRNHMTLWPWELMIALSVKFHQTGTNTHQIMSSLSTVVYLIKWP